MNHGAREPFFGVKVEDLKKIQKRIKVDYQLALDLYDTGNSDAMYLAGLIADDAKMTKKDLQRWVDQAYWHMLSEYTVPWVATGSPHGHDLALKWIEAEEGSRRGGRLVHARRAGHDPPGRRARPRRDESAAEADRHHHP